MPGHVEKIWLEYRQRVIPKSAPPIQLVETRRAFYSGSAALLSILLTQFRQDVADGKK